MLVVVLVLVATLVLAVVRSSLFWPDCSGEQMFAKAEDPAHAVFTARVIRAGHSEKISGRWAGEWAIGVVEESFWGLPRWPRLVLLTNNLFWEGETYFVSGWRQQGLVSRFLPMVDATRCGTHYSQRVAEARIPLRVLRNPMPAGQRRIIGYVSSSKLPRREPQLPAMTPERRRTYEGILTSPAKVAPLAGARVSLTGSSGTRVVTTDQDGIYEFTAVPLDGYTLQLLDVPANQVAMERRVPRLQLERMPVSREDILAQWDGSIEGRVRDAAGGPAQVWIGLQELDGAIWRVELSEKDGSFRIGELPMGGRCMLQVNPYGPADYSPYASGYYPLGARREQAAILEIKAEDPHVKHVDMVMARPVERTLDVRVSWPDGKAVNGAERWRSVDDPFVGRFACAGDGAVRWGYGEGDGGSL